MAKDQPVSSLLLDELLSSEDERFVPALLGSTDSKQIAAYADRLIADPRPWAREQWLRCAGAIRAALRGESEQDPWMTERRWRPLIKRLFKHAEAARDDEVVGAFGVLFDTMVRRRVRTRHRYDWRSRTTWEEQTLTVRRRRTDGFSYHTRFYLRRRAWRYFRRMGHQRPADYCAAIARTLALYEDAELTSGLDILDSWSLAHACFGKHDVLDLRSPSHVRVKAGRDLGELAPAPYFLPLWQQPTAVPILLTLVEQGRARVVRVWAIGLLRRQHGRRLAGVTVDHIVRLLDHADEEVQQFGAELLEALPNLETLEPAMWLRLLGTRNLTALETVAQLMRRHVSAAQLPLETALDLATAKPAPVARLGLEYLRQKQIATRAEAGMLARGASAKSAAVSGELATWALNVLGDERFYDADAVIAYFDSLQRTARDAAWTWLVAGSRAYDDPAVWARLLETPFDDARLKLVEALRARSSLPGQGTAQLAPLWATVLLNVHRGGRHKLVALRQISEALTAEVGDAEQLLPVLAVALRSVRPPEARAGLAAIVRAADRRPELLEVLARYLPELRVVGEVEACS